jgi:glycosyltransferase involved in cell wall biosynthesis
MHSGGVERGTVEVAQALIERGHRALVISAGGRLVGQLESMGAMHITLPIAKKSPLTLCYARRLRSILRDEQVDIAHARSRVPAWVTSAALRKMPAHDAPMFITTVHGLYSVNRYSKIMTTGDRVICVSQAAKQYVLDNYSDADESRLTVIPRGIDPADFPFGHKADPQWQERWLSEHPALNGKIILTLPGRITRLKGHEFFINLIEKLAREGHNVAGVIIGNVHPRKQRYAQSLEQLIAQKNLNDRVLILPPTDRIRDVYAMSTIVYSLSTTPESFGRTTLEALSVGVPAIGFDHGGIHEILRQLCPQGLVPLRDADSLCKTTNTMLHSPPQIPSKHDMTKSTMLNRILDVYESSAADRANHE